MIGVNRVGNDPKLHYNGFGSLFDPMGKEIATVENEEKIIEVEISKSYVDEVRKKLPFLEDMRLI
jgi:predicted amidohydrolase